MTAYDPAAPEPGTGTREALAGGERERREVTNGSVELATILAEHRIIGPACTCGWKVPPSVPWLPTHEAHLAAALAPEVARIEAEAREAEQERIAAAIEALFVKGWLVYNSGIADAARIARSRP